MLDIVRKVFDASYNDIPGVGFHVSIYRISTFRCIEIYRSIDLEISFFVLPYYHCVRTRRGKEASVPVGTPESGVIVLGRVLR